MTPCLWGRGSIDCATKRKSSVLLMLLSLMLFLWLVLCFAVVDIFGVDDLVVGR
jgi:hypothetical protein